MFDLMISVISMAIKINSSSWSTTIPILIFGMIGIFLVIGVIIVATYAINKIFSKKKDENEE